MPNARTWIINSPFRKNERWRTVPSSKMRILWISHSGSLGGAELALIEGVGALASRGDAVDVVLPEDGPLRDRLTSKAMVHVSNHLLWVTSQHGVLDKGQRLAYSTLVSAPRIARIARRTRADVVISNTLATMAGGPAARLASLPHVWFVHEFGREPFVLGDDLTFRIMRGSMRLCLVTSEALKSHFREPFRGVDVAVVPQAVEVPPTNSAYPSRPDLRLILIGAKAPFKGQLEAIQAVAALARLGLAVHLQLVGPDDGGFESTLRQSAIELGVAERVEFLPFDDNPFALIEAADVVLVCSRIEAFGRTTVEGMKAGKAVVAADGGATPELITHGWNGYLYRPGDTADLTKWLEACYSDRPALREMGQRGQQWAQERFNVDRFGSELHAALSRAVNGR